MIKNKKWFSLPLAMWLVIVISLLAHSILEYIIPFSRDIKGVENSSKAYYQANNWIEEWLFNVYVRNNSLSINDTTEYSDSNFNLTIDWIYKTNSSWATLPPVWEWNSGYDKDWNIIYQWNPIQLSIWNGYLDLNNDDLRIAFKVPDANWVDSDDLVLKWWDLPIVNWQLSSSTNTLNASWSIIKAKDVCKANDLDCNPNTWWNLNIIDINSLQWVDLDLNEWPDQVFQKFYQDNCLVSSACILKFSIINKLDLTTLSLTSPYLEWILYLDTPSSNKLPLRYTKIEASWKSYGYRKDIEVKVAWNTLNEAFDFTVFQ